MTGMAPRARSLVVVVVLAAAVAGCGGERRADRAPRGPVVGCGDVILNFDSGSRDGYRPVLDGAVSVPPAYIGQVVRSDVRAWPFWEKAGLLVHAGRGPVDVLVPVPARGRAAVGWGDAARRPGHALRIDRCPGTGWNVYAGGFFLKRRRGCVPVTFRVGARRTTVTFGLRRRGCEP
jgi:hypothetical protein